MQKKQPSRHAFGTGRYPRLSKARPVGGGLYLCTGPGLGGTAGRLAQSRGLPPYMRRPNEKYA